jgi:hypothetical protein
MMKVLPDLLRRIAGGPPAEAAPTARPPTSMSVKRMRRNARAMARSGWGLPDIGAAGCG